MKLKKRYSFPITTLLITLITSLALIISVNIILKHDVFTETKSTLNDNIINYKLFTMQDFESNEVVVGVAGDAMFTETGNREIIVTWVDLNEDISNLYNNVEKQLLNHIKATEYELGSIDVIDIGKNKVFYSVVLQDIEIYVIYVNTGEYLYTLQILNQIFTIVSLLVSVLSIIIGYKIGLHYENSENQLKRFFNNVSHELKTPLTSIQGYTESIYQEISPDIKKSSKTVLEQCKLMEKQIEELLLLSKIDSGAIRLEKDEFNFYDTLDRLISYSEPLAKNKNIEIIRDFDRYEALITCDEKYIYNAFNAILSNAIRYARSRIEIKVVKEKSKIIVTIKDDGIGINENDMPYIFQRFYIGENGGTGIGLSLANEIIKLHNGNIIVQNKDGAIFQVTLMIYSKNS